MSCGRTLILRQQINEYNSNKLLHCLVKLTQCLHSWKLQDHKFFNTACCLLAGIVISSVVHCTPYQNLNSFCLKTKDHISLYLLTSLLTYLLIYCLALHVFSRVRKDIDFIFCLGPFFSSEDTLKVFQDLFTFWELQSTVSAIFVVCHISHDVFRSSLYYLFAIPRNFHFKSVWVDR